MLVFSNSDDLFKWRVISALKSLNALRLELGNL